MKEEYLYEELDAYLSNFEGKLSQEEIGRLRLVAEHFYLCGENPNVNLMPQLPANLDDAAENYLAPIENDEGLDYINFNGRDIKDAFIAGAKWQKSQMIRDCSAQASYEAEIEKAEERGYNLCKEQMPMPEDTVIFQKGVEEGKRLMLEDAVEASVNYYENIPGGSYVELVADIPNPTGVRYKDKVKVIIVPEKEDGK